MTDTATSPTMSDDHLDLSLQGTDACTEIARADDIEPGRGVAALVAGRAVAVFCLDATSDHDGPSEASLEWYAVSHDDPVCGAPVMARGLVGSFGADDTPTVASPLDKRRYSLVTGECLNADGPGLETFEVLVAAGVVLVASPH